MNYVVLSFAWAIGLLSVAHFLSVDPASANDFDGETTASVLNVRTGPGVKHHVVASVPQGTLVSILEAEGGWARISASGSEGPINGWVSENFLEVYELALPRVASTGIGEKAAEEIPSLTQPSSLPSAETTDVTTMGNTNAIMQPEADLIEQSDQDVARPLEVPSAIVATEPKTDQPAHAPVNAENAEVEISSLETEIQEQEQISTGEDSSKSEALSDPLAYKALDISCRRGYFSDALEACVADIEIEVSVPESFAGLLSDNLNVKCDVGFNYEAGGDRLAETSSDVARIQLNEGKGYAIMESRIDFLFRVDGVTRVEVGSIECAAVSAVN
jgi:hypothetical protein